MGAPIVLLSFFLRSHIGWNIMGKKKVKTKVLPHYSEPQKRKLIPPQ
jgi:hypothetical protein